MASDWKTFTLEELASDQKSALATGPFGSAISSKFFQECGIPVIRGGNLSANTSKRMSDDGLVFVSEEKATEFKRSVVRKGDLIFTCWGTINQVGLLDEQRNYDEYIISNKQMKVTLDVDKADPLFVYYMFSGPKKQKEILQNRGVLSPEQIHALATKTKRAMSGAAASAASDSSGAAKPTCHSDYVDDETAKKMQEDAAI